MFSVHSILGMNLFGCKFCERDDNGEGIDCDRKNFDSLLWALVTVFQVLEPKLRAPKLSRVDLLKVFHYLKDFLISYLCHKVIVSLGRSTTTYLVVTCNFRYSQMTICIFILNLMPLVYLLFSLLYWSVIISTYIGHVKKCALQRVPILKMKKKKKCGSPKFIFALT